MALWFRFYSDAMRNPKVAKLSDGQFRLWCELLCVAAENDGKIPPANDLKHVLKRRLDHLLTGLKGLLRASLIDALEDGYEPHGWAKRQYKSDTSTERVRKLREKRNVSVTPPEPETEPETEITPDGVGISDESPPPISVDELVGEWNDLAAECGLPKIAKLTDARRRRAKVRLKQYPELEAWQRAFACIRQSKWMHGDNAKGWRADFDFLLQDKSFTRLVEGTYGQA